LFNTNERVNAFNANLYQGTNSSKVSISAFDQVISDDSPAVKEQLVSRIPNDSTHTAGLCKTVGIAEGITYDLCLNLDVDDGLVNGSSCTVKKIDYRQQNTTRPSIIWVVFNSNEIGSMWRAKYHHLYDRSVDPSWTPIFDCKRSFLYLRKIFMRVQIPLRQSTAKTVHKSQRDTVSEVVIDMSGNRVFPHAHYVAISRAKTLKGLHILELNESKISVSEKVIKEMTRLRENKKMQQCYTPVYCLNQTYLTCLFQNIRSLRSHKDEFFADPNVQASSILCLVETWLTHTDSEDNYQQTGYQMFRADGVQVGNTRPHRGVLVYVKDDILVTNSYSVTTKDIEMVITTVLFNKQSTNIVALYNSPTSSVEHLKTFLYTNLALKQQECLIIQGDLNINLYTNEDMSNYMLNTFGCTQLVQKPTHSSGSLIDHVYTNMKLGCSDVIDSVWSDHCMVYAAFPYTE